MEILPRLREMARMMHQDVPLFVSMAEESELIEYLVEGESAEDATATSDFIDSLLSSDLTDKDLADLWIKAGSDWFVSEPGIPRFLTLLRDRLRRS
ncbi:hypothetical protein ACTDI4_08975 [Mesorhizobium sp. PUT5]|uniref:hypothetical protein n=1 Tax=Mesorhizobium sp. PUT5 TaxID=3454629 RepID=UPI003FA46615